MNYELLKKLFSIYSPSHEEDKMTKFLTDFLTEHNIPFNVDEFGNIYKMDCPQRPTICCHQDQVSKPMTEALLIFNEIKEIDGKQYFIGRGNLGADDKCGIFILLSYLTEVKSDINFILSVGEEVSAKEGIKYVVEKLKNNEAFNTTPYCLVLDRKGSSDIICSQNCYGDVEFENDLLLIGTKYGFKSAKGLYSDADTLRNYMNCANISVGYYLPHTENEFFCINEMMNTYEFVKEFLDLQF